MKSDKILVLTSGMVVVDIISAGLVKIASPGELIYTPRHTEVRTGGHPHNVAIDLAKLGIVPQKIGVVSCVGQDIFGKLIEEVLDKCKIKRFLQKTKKAPTGKDTILVVRGQDRRFHLDPGANLYLSPAYVKRILRKTNPKVFSIRPGYSGVDLKLPFILKGLKETFVLLDVCQPYKKPWSYILPALKYVDCLHGNSKEIMNLAGEKSINKAIRKLFNSGIKILFITHGERGATVLTKEFSITQSGFRAKAIDPTGCGDAFCAGIIYKLVELGRYDPWNFDKNLLARVLRFAQACGAAAAIEIGCTEGVSEKVVAKILKQRT